MGGCYNRDIDLCRYIMHDQQRKSISREKAPPKRTTSEVPEREGSSTEEALRRRLMKEADRVPSRHTT